MLDDIQAVFLCTQTLEIANQKKVKVSILSSHKFRTDNYIDTDIDM